MDIINFERTMEFSRESLKAEVSETLGAQQDKSKFNAVMGLLVVLSLFTMILVVPMAIIFAID